MATTVDLTSYQFLNNRDLFRKQLINLFLNEAPGTGKGGNTSKYDYIVKKFIGHDVFLRRPAQFNNGFDFTLNVSNINWNLTVAGGRATTRPSHGHILKDLEAKKNSNPIMYAGLLVEISNIYNCTPLLNANFQFTAGHSSELILECIKWLFAEQDVTYWNYSGRAMFYDSILLV